MRKEQSVVSVVHRCVFEHGFDAPMVRPPFAEESTGRPTGGPVITNDARDTPLDTSLHSPRL